MRLITILTLCILLQTSCYRPGQISYNRDIRPIFNKKCLSCHGGIKQSGGFSLLFEEDAFANTDSGNPAIVRGRSNKSEIIARIQHHDPELRMPFELEPLSENEISLIEQWIREGAVWEQHWAYVPPDNDIHPPLVENTEWPQNEIDHFILSRLEKENLEPNPEADKPTLLRRLSLDLIGLPPTLEEVASFENDNHPDAYKHQVDRLLASPHFGEKWATMWLDLARYADSKGYEKDLYRSIWKYRDYVISAFNEDKPFDLFTIEQLAGDLLPNPTQDQLIATAFHRNTMANDEGGTDNEEYRNYANIERVGTTFEVWQGTTLACVQCHSHPYDPFRQEDFYEFLAFFNNTADRDIYHEGPNLFTYEGSDKEEAEEIIEWIHGQLEGEDKIETEGFLHQQKQDLLQHLGYHKIEAEHFDKSSPLIELNAPEQNTLFQIQDRSWIRFEQLELANIESISYRYTSPFGGFMEARLDSQFGELIGSTKVPVTGHEIHLDKRKIWRIGKMPFRKTIGKHDLYFVFRKDRIAAADLFRMDYFLLHEGTPRMDQYDREFRNKVEELAFIAPTPTPILQELPLDKRRTTRLFDRGNWLVKGKEVHADIPEILGAPTVDIPKDRLTMAKWLVSPANPLTARVAVNRIWEQLFGFGIVETVEDFGTQGIRPTHPELLDWLAVQFSGSDGWRFKKLLNRIVLSAAYRQDAQVDSIKLQKDPRNLLLSRGPRLRLSAEQLRDQILAVSGLLNPKIYGRSVNPPYPEGTGRFLFGDVYEVSDTANQRRRSLYTYIKRTNTFPNRINFDGTDRTSCTSRRISTNTPLQALALLNNPAYLEAAEMLARYTLDLDLPSEREKLEQAYRKVMLRPPNREKVNVLLKLYAEASSNYGKENQLASYTLVANTLLNLDEFINK